MCDTLVVVRPGTVLFAKNSDRDPNEAQWLDWQPGREHPEGAVVRCTWISIPQARRTHAVLLSRPFWMWGAEMGANEHGVVIGNEAVFTRQPYAKQGLTGMDLLRLTLERSISAEEAVAVLTALLATHGQGGGCGHEDRGFTYHNSFIVADPHGATVVETAGPEVATEKVTGARSISNGLTIPAFAEQHSDRLRSRVSACVVRRGLTEAGGAKADSPAGMMRVLRSHGAEDWPRYRFVNGTLTMPCMHGGGVVASSVSTASWVAELRPGHVRHWVTGTAAPCLSLFKPVRVEEPLDLGPPPTDRMDADTLWWAHERLHRQVMRDPARLAAAFLPERDALERTWLASPPNPAEAFAEHKKRIASWTRRVEEAGPGSDSRPFWARRYWRVRQRRAG